MILKANTTYKNTLGAVLIVTGPYFGKNPATLGGIWEATQPDDLFGDMHYLVTPESMEASGYAEFTGSES